MNKQRAQVRVASLADAKQLYAPAGAALPWHQAQVRGKLPPGAKRPGISHRRHRGRCREQPDSRDRGDALAVCLPALPGRDLALDLGHLFGQAANPLDLPPKLASQQRWHARRCVVECHYGLGQHPAPALGQLDTELTHEPMDLVDRSRAVLLQSLPYRVQPKHRLLLLSLDRNKAHFGLLRCCPDRLSVGSVVLVRHDEGAHELRGDQLDLVPNLGKFPRPVLRRAARLHDDDRGLQLRKMRQHLRAAQLGPCHLARN